MVYDYTAMGIKSYLKLIKFTKQQEFLLETFLAQMLLQSNSVYVLYDRLSLEMLRGKNLNNFIKNI